MGGEGPKDDGEAAVAVGHDVAAVLAVLDGVGGESAKGEGQLGTLHFYRLRDVLRLLAD